MIEHYEEVKVVQLPSVITCDVCGKRFSLEDNEFEFQEIYSISFTGGYGSIFGDGTHIGCEICQRCLMSLIGDFCYYETEDGFKRLKA